LAVGTASAQVETRARVQATKAIPGTIHVETVPSGARVTIDAEAEPAPTQTPVDIELRPGKHTLKVTREGFESVDLDVDVTDASKQQLRVELRKTERAKPATPPAEAVAGAEAATAPPKAESNTASIVLTGGIAVAAAAAGTYFSLRALSLSRDFERNPTTATADDGQVSALVADILFGIAAPCGVATILLLVMGTSADQPDGKTGRATTPGSITVTAAPYATPTGGGAGAVVRF
jgi:hypothetical protein